MVDLMPERGVNLDEVADGSTARSAAQGPAGLNAVDERLIAQLVGQARAGGLRLPGEGRVLAELLMEST